MLRDELEMLRKQHIYSKDDVYRLIYICEVLMRRNSKIARELKDALTTVIKLQDRVDFYRKTTTKIVQ